MFSKVFRTLTRLNIPSSLKPDLSFNKVSFPKHNYSSALSSGISRFPAQEVLDDREDLKITKDTIANVNNLISEGEEGRLFAVIHVCGKQFKITTEDIIIVEGHWPPMNGDEIKFEKILLVGGRDFTLVGRPILPQGLVSIKATVIDKDLSHTKTIFYKRRRKQYMRMNFFRSQLTMLRINEIIVEGKINEPKDVTSYERI